jgi:hypothetical protein
VGGDRTLREGDSRHHVGQRRHAQAGGLDPSVPVSIRTAILLNFF